MWPEIWGGCLATRSVVGGIDTSSPHLFLSTDVRQTGRHHTSSDSDQVELEYSASRSNHSFIEKTGADVPQKNKST